MAISNKISAVKNTAKKESGINGFCKAGNKKRGMELSLNTVIVAALVIIVLIVLTIIFTKSIGKSNKSIYDCTNKNGKACTRNNCISKGGVPIFEIDEGKSETSKNKGGGDGSSSTNTKVCCISLYGDNAPDCS